MILFEEKILFKKSGLIAGYSPLCTGTHATNATIIHINFDFVVRVRLQLTIYWANSKCIIIQLKLIFFFPLAKNLLSNYVQLFKFEEGAGAETKAAADCTAVHWAAELAEPTELTETAGMPGMFQSTDPGYCLATPDLSSVTSLPY